MLTEMIFKDVEIEQWLAVETDKSLKGFDAIIGSQGTARDRIDDARVEFTALVAQSKDMQRGIIVVGAWKNPAQKNVVIKTIDSLVPPDMSKD